MNFTMPVNKTVATMQGHTIEFLAGVPTHVPKECWRAVQTEGAVPEDQQAAQAQTPQADPVVDDPVERRSRIFAAFETMVAANKREDFAASGSPAIKSLTAVVGFDVDVKERDALWTEFQQSM